MTLSKSLQELLPEFILPAELASVVVSDVALDSRKAVAGSLFLALKGQVLDGKGFVPAAFAQGAVVACVEGENFSAEKQPAGWVVTLPNLIKQVSAIAERFYGGAGRSMHIAAITGTNGKTTISQLLGQLYRHLGNVSAVMGTLGYGVVGQPLIDTGMTTPDAVEVQKILARLREASVTHLAIEVSSHALAMGRVESVAMQTAIFTNLTRDHLDYHGSMHAYGQAKASLFSRPELRNAIVNNDDPFATEILSVLAESVNTYTFSVSDTYSHVFAEDIVYSDKGIQARLVTPWGCGELRSQLLGEFNLSNLLAVVTAACANGFDLASVLATLPTLVPVAGRMQRVACRDLQIIVDYAHTPDALRAVLAAARLHTNKKLWCVFGCGGDRDAGKRVEMAKIAEQLADKIVVTSDNPRSENPSAIVDEIMEGFSGTAAVKVEVDRKLAIELAVSQAATGDLIVIAGKGHEDYQIIGSKKYDFSDLLIAQAAVEIRHGAAND